MKQALNVLHHNKSSIIKIAGAGPSGLTAAMRLARSGYPVELFEARERVGERFIGDFQVIENASFREDVTEMLKRIGVKRNFFFKPIHRAIFYDHKLRPQAVQSKRPYGYFILRGPEKESLDQGLLAQALSAGAKIHYRSRLTKEEADIIASGPAVADGLAKEMTFSTNLPDTVSVLFDMNVSPGAYSYLFVLDGHATFGCAITKDFDAIRNYFDLSFDRFQEITPFSVKQERYSYSYMNFCLKASAMVDKKPYIGEAGGFQDYLFGLGIRYAMKTGFSAAESIIRKASYDDLWKKEIGAMQEVSLVNRYLYERGGNWGLSSFVKRAGRGDLQNYLGKWHAQNPWKQFLLFWVKQFWKSESRCFHRLSKHWCREKQFVSSQSSLGPIHLGPEKPDPESVGRSAEK